MQLKFNIIKYRNCPFRITELLCLEAAHPMDLPHSAPVIQILRENIYAKRNNPLAKQRVRPLDMMYFTHAVSLQRSFQVSIQICRRIKIRIRTIKIWRSHERVTLVMGISSLNKMVLISRQTFNDWFHERKTNGGPHSVVWCLGFIGSDDLLVLAKIRVFLTEFHQRVVQ